MARGKAKADQRAATRGGGFTGLPHVVQDSEAYRTLSLHARAVLDELIRVFNGYNNAKLGASFDHLCHRLNTTNRRAISAALIELFEHGMIDFCAPANRKHHKAREYRLTFISTGDDKRHVQATEDYRGWKTAQNHGDYVSPKSAVHGDDVSPCPVFHGDNVSLRLVGKRRKCVEAVPIHGDDVSLHISRPYPRSKIPDASAPSAWWASDAELSAVALIAALRMAAQPQLRAAA